METPSRSASRLRVPTAFLVLCLCLLLVEGNLPSQQASQSLPGCIMLAALPHRRVSGERCAITPTVTETVCTNVIDVSQVGFTLIELSIVLVVIGLIAGACWWDEI